MTRHFHILVWLAAITLVATLLGSCAANPVTGESDFVVMSEGQEIGLGRKTDPEIRKQYGVYDDPDLQAYVQRVGERLAKKSHRPGLKFTFTVLDSDEVNAFALPGGYIYITRGILAYFQNEAELAAVLGHEIGHVTARHGVTQVSKAWLLEQGFNILSSGNPALQNQAGQLVLNLLGNAFLLGYGRENELQADRLGAEYIARTGYDPDAVIGVVGILKNQEEFEKKRAAAENREPRVYHGVFASHPSADSRLQQAVAEANKFKTGAATRVARDDYLKHLDGTIFGNKSREGVLRGTTLYHRNFDIAVDFPEGWKVANLPKSVTATAPGDTALLDLGVADIGKNANPREFMRARLEVSNPKHEEKLTGKLLGHSAVTRTDTSFGERETRVSIVFHGDKAFTLLGAAKDDAQFGHYDSRFLAAARSLRPLSPQEKKLADGLRLRTKKAVAGDSFASLAKKSPLSQYSESILRLINARFPEGEPKPGELIKVIE